MSFPTAPPTSETERPEPSPRSDRFFAWVAGLGLARSDGWIGGVAAGIASRLRIDPLIVRGVLVVAALFGLPMIILYAAAWALLPDPKGRIHLRELFHGRFQPAHLGIFGGLLVGMLTVTPTAGLFLVGRIINPYSFQTYGVSGFGVFLFIVGLVLVGILLVLIVRAARRTPGGLSSDPRMASAAPSAPFPSAPAGLSGAVATAETREGDAAAMPASPLVQEPDMPADPDELMAWRAQHAAWQEQDRAWRQQQQDAERAARDQARQERQTTAAAFAAEAAERRRARRASNPRASFAYVATVIGVALVAATVVWLWSQNPDAATAGMALFTAALVLAFGMIVAGVARRRSGFLAFVTVATLVAGLVTSGAASMGDVRFGYGEASNLDSGALRQPFGRTYVSLLNVLAPASHPVVIHKGVGDTVINVGDGVELQLIAIVEDVDIEWNRMEMNVDGTMAGTATGTFTGETRPDGSTVFQEVISSPHDPEVTDAPNAVTLVPVTIDQQSGRIVIVYSSRPEKETAK